MRNKKEQVEKNLDLAFDFIKKVVADPSILDKAEDKSELKFVGDDNEPVLIARKNYPVRKKSLTKKKSFHRTK